MPSGDMQREAAAVEATATPLTESNTRLVAEIVAIFRACLDRDPDEEGMAFYVDAINTGALSLADIRQELATCPEARENHRIRYAISRVYMDVLRRRADAGGIKAYLGQIKWNDKTLADVAKDLRKSREYRELQPARIFLRKSLNGFRLKPSFLVIGAQHSGSDALFNTLVSHPDILPPLHNELSFFNRFHALGLPWYWSCFPLRQPFLGKGRTTGEATCHYLFNACADIPARVKQVMPNVKLVAVLRNPVYRAYSHYQMNVDELIETRSFEDAMEFELINNPEKKYNRYKAALEDPYEPLDYSYIGRGFYARQLRQWLEYFPESQIRVVLREDLENDYQAVVSSVLDFLRIPRASLDFHPLASEFTPDDIGRDTCEWLQGYFRPSNKDLEDLIGRKIAW